MAPCFFTEADLIARAAQDDQLIWDNTTWISGHSNVADSPSNFSTYDVLDALVEPSTRICKYVCLYFRLGHGIALLLFLIIILRSSSLQATLLAAK